MDRRRFLALLAGGALGNVTGVTLSTSEPGRGRPAGLQPPLERIEPAGTGVRRIVWSVETDRPVCALTFDDGPDPQFTPRILEILRRHDARATFMAMGYNAIRHPGLLRDALAAGHEIGSHSWSHIMLPTATAEETRVEIERGTHAVERTLGTTVRLFRPPHGRLTEAAVRAAADLDHDIVMWSLTRGELRWRDPHRVAEHVVSGLGPGQIIDFHDGIGRGTFNPGGEVAARLRRRRTTEVEALPAIIEGIRTKGLELVTISELLGEWRPNGGPPSPDQGPDAGAGE